ncbi:MAG: rRNA maturation RNase YbeY [Patescibacteria group bacterium]|jgi:probable rRNA maturation factor
MSQVFIGYDGYGIEGVDDEFIRFIFDVVLGSANKSLDSEAGLILANDDKMKSLNQRYRGKDKSTNVLSFENKDIVGVTQAQSDKNYLGDVYISCETLAQEAKGLRISDKERFAQLFVHGLLHLLGFDHEQSADAKEMESLEDRIVQLVL